MKDLERTRKIDGGDEALCEDVRSLLSSAARDRLPTTARERLVQQARAFDSGAPVKLTAPVALLAAAAATKVSSALAWWGAAAALVTAGAIGWGAVQGNPPAGAEVGSPQRSISRPEPAALGGTTGGTGAAPGTRSDVALETELQALRAVRGRLVAGQADDALAELALYARRHPAGLLRLEATLLEVQALISVGRRAEAEARARRLLAHPSGALYRTRVDELLGARR